jgi:tRNA threonylcarbamoyl adenosine modification protein (Sua5/YciO/YrdC/YwlC family)
VIVDEEHAVSALAAGEVVAIPTDTVYGLGVDPSRHETTRRLFLVKGRPQATALPVLVADVDTAGVLGVLDVRAAVLAEHFWPGALTIVVDRQPNIAFELGGDPSTIGLRCPAHPSTLHLLGLTGPLAVTSANRHGEAPCRSAAEVAAAFGDSLPVLDGGVCDGEPSTVVSLSAAPNGVACLREGAVLMADVERVLEGKAPAGL